MDQLSREQERKIVSMVEDIESLAVKYRNCEDFFMCLASSCGVGYATLGVPFYDVVSVVGYAYKERVSVDG